MNKVAFIGSYDKADLMLYVAKVLTILGKKVILVDATALQKTRYIIPKMTPAKKYCQIFCIYYVFSIFIYWSDK